MAAQLRQIELPGGSVVMARITPAGYDGEDQDIGVMDRAVAKVEQLNELIVGVGSAVLDAAAAVRPDEASIAFGVELSAKTGGVLAVLAEGEAKASVQVTLTWQLNGADPAPSADV